MLPCFPTWSHPLVTIPDLLRVHPFHSYISTRILQSLLQTSVDGDSLVYYGRHLELTVLSTWGDPHYVGLAGIQVIGKFGETLTIGAESIDAKPIKCVASLPGESVSVCGGLSLLQGCVR